MSMIALIGGTGLGQIEGLRISDQKLIETPYGDPSSVLSFGELNGQKVVFIARHGDPHKIPPHLINYRANMGALKQVGVNRIIAVNAVGGIHKALGPAELSIPDQIIDYTYGRDHTIFDGTTYESTTTDSLDHIDFTHPYDEELRLALIAAAESESIVVLKTGTYGATQGPRLESSAEVQRLKADGCDLIGMTGMPEAALAKEMGMKYASISLSVNWAAGISDTIITMDDIGLAIDQGMGKVLSIINAYVASAI